MRKHVHYALSDPMQIALSSDRPKCLHELICRLSKKPYAVEFAAFWVMYTFIIVAPMSWNGDMFEGEATGFITIWKSKDNVVNVQFYNRCEYSELVIGNVDVAEKFIDSLVFRLFHE